MSEIALRAAKAARPAFLILVVVGLVALALPSSIPQPPTWLVAWTGWLLQAVTLWIGIVLGGSATKAALNGVRRTDEKNQDSARPADAGTRG